MRKADEIYNTVRENNRKVMSCQEAAIKCIRIAREEMIIKCAKIALECGNPILAVQEIKKLIKNV